MFRYEVEITYTSGKREGQKRYFVYKFRSDARKKICSELDKGNIAFMKKVFVNFAEIEEDLASIGINAGDMKNERVLFHD